MGLRFGLQARQGGGRSGKKLRHGIHDCLAILATKPLFRGTILIADHPIHIGGKRGRGIMCDKFGDRGMEFSEAAATAALDLAQDGDGP